jgi:hypothetical protein
LPYSYPSFLFGQISNQPIGRALLIKAGMKLFPDMAIAYIRQDITNGLDQLLALDATMNHKDDISFLMASSFDLIYLWFSTHILHGMQSLLSVLSSAWLGQKQMLSAFVSNAS